MPRVPVVWREWGESPVPTVEFSLKARGRVGRLHDYALLDTGANVSVVSADLLSLRRFDAHNLPLSGKALQGVGGPAKAHLLGNAVMALRDEQGVLHPANLPAIYVVKDRMVPIVGRDLLEALSAVLTIDFATRAGHLEIG